MFDWLANWLNTSGFMPHGYCISWRPSLLWQFVIADALTAASYYSIPAALVVFVRRRRDMSFSWVALMFSAFIFACGTTHLIGVVTLWYPIYWVDAGARTVTAIVSVITAVMLWILLPKALRIPSAAQLQAVVRRLEQEISEREQAEHALRNLNEELEQRVLERTSALRDTVDELHREAASRERAEHALLAQKERLRITLGSIADGVIATDEHGRIEYMNPAAEDMTGWPLDIARGRLSVDVFRIVDAGSGEISSDPVAHVLRSGKQAAVAENVALVARDGHRIEVEDSAAPIRGDDEVLVGAVLVFHDVSAARRMAAHMTHLAQHDALTNLPNRLLLSDRLLQAIQQAERHRRMGALMYIDLDHFKSINDSMGHVIGDRLLCAIAERLRECVRGSDTVSRQGGDEFVVLLPELENRDGAARVAQAVLRELAKPVMLDERELHISVSIGIALFPEDANEPDELARCADAAMYQVKSSGRNNFEFFRHAIRQRVAARALVEQGLRKAMERDEFSLHYQPKVSLQTQEIVGVEALIRWRHPERGWISPEEFIPVAEDSGLIGAIGQWVLDEALEQHRLWREVGLPELRIAVNLSLRQLEREALRERIMRTIRNGAVEPRWLEFEITERIAMLDEQETLRWLHELREFGVGIAIDDFGTGYSSLSYLKRLPVDTVKIDKSFIRDIETDQEDAAIIKAIISMAHSLDIEVVAEGVETERQLALLRAQECNQAQGYLVCRPLPPGELVAFMRSNAAWHLQGDAAE